MDEGLEYFGFGINGKKVVKIFGQGKRFWASPSSLDELDAIERLALWKDRSPTSFYYEDMAAVSSDGVEIIYAHGKDLTPFKPLEFIGFLNDRLADPGMAPVILNLQLEQTCNDACTFCSTHDIRLNNPVYRGKKFTLDEAMHLIDHMADGGGKLIEIIGSGEGTAHPDFLKLVNHLGERGLMLSLYTNGKNFVKGGGLNMPMLEALAQHCALLNVSLDGYANRHKIHRGTTADMTEKIYKGIELIASLRDPAKVGMYNSFTVSSGCGEPDNFHDLRDVVQRQLGTVEAMHIQNNFHTYSHQRIDAQAGHDMLQGIIDDHMGRMYLYFNYPMIKHFKLLVPYEDSCINQRFAPGERCYRGLLYPSVESGSNGAWPCYVGNGTATHAEGFGDMLDRLQAIRASFDSKLGRDCAPCINTSFNRFFIEYLAHAQAHPGSEYFTLYKRKNLEAALGGRGMESKARGAGFQ